MLAKPQQVRRTIFGLEVAIDLPASERSHLWVVAIAKGNENGRREVFTIEAIAEKGRAERSRIFPGGFQNADARQHFRFAAFQARQDLLHQLPGGFAGGEDLVACQADDFCRG